MRQLDVYSFVKPPLPRAGQLSINDVPPAGVCTPSDPMGAGRSGPTLHAPGVGERSLEQEMARRQESADDLGYAIQAPIWEGWKIVLATREPTAWSDALSFVHDLYEDGVEGAAADWTLSAVIDKTVDAFMRRKGLRYNRPLKALKPLIKETIRKGVEAGGGRVKEWYDKHRDPSGKWSKEDDDIQRAVDREEERQRTDPGTGIA